MLNNGGRSACSTSKNKSWQSSRTNATGLVSEMLTASGETGVSWLIDLFKAIVKEGSIPADWKKSWMVSVYKGKGDALDCGSYRGIKLLDQVMKVFESNRKEDEESGQPGRHAVWI